MNNQIVSEFDGIGLTQSKPVNVTNDITNDHNISNLLGARSGMYGVSLSYGKHAIEINRVSNSTSTSSTISNNIKSKFDKYDKYDKYVKYAFNNHNHDKYSMSSTTLQTNQ